MKGADVSQPDLGKREAADRRSEETSSFDSGYDRIVV